MTPNASKKYDPQYSAAGARGTHAGVSFAGCEDLEGARALHEIHLAALRYTRSQALANSEDSSVMIRVFKAAANLAFVEARGAARSL